MVGYCGVKRKHLDKSQQTYSVYLCKRLDVDVSLISPHPVSETLVGQNEVLCKARNEIKVSQLP
jgi:hypothetical protein